MRRGRRYDVDEGDADNIHMKEGEEVWKAVMDDSVEWILGGRLGPFTVAEEIKPGSLVVMYCYASREDERHLVRFDPPNGLAFHQKNKTKVGFVTFQIPKGKVDPKNLPGIGCKAVEEEETFRNLPPYSKRSKRTQQRVRKSYPFDSGGVYLNCSQFTFLLMLLFAMAYYFYSLHLLPKIKMARIKSAGDGNAATNTKRHEIRVGTNVNRRRNKAGKGTSKSKKSGGKDLRRRAGETASRSSRASSSPSRDHEKNNRPLSKWSRSPSPPESEQYRLTNEEAFKDDRRGNIDHVDDDECSDLVTSETESNPNPDATDDDSESSSSSASADLKNQTPPRETHGPATDEKTTVAETSIPIGHDDDDDVVNNDARMQQEMDNAEKGPPAKQGQDIGEMVEEASYFGDTADIITDDNMMELESEECLRTKDAMAAGRGQIIRPPSGMPKPAGTEEPMPAESSVPKSFSIPATTCAPPATTDTTTDSASSLSSSKQTSNIIVLQIEGMSCAGCVGVVNRVLKSFQEIDSVVTDLKTCTSTISYNVRRLNLLPMLTALDDVGMQAYLQSQTVAPVRPLPAGCNSEMHDKTTSTLLGTTITTATTTTTTTTSDGISLTTLCPVEEHRKRQPILGAIGRPLAASVALSTKPSNPLSLMDELREGSTPLRRYQCSCGCGGCICSDRQVHENDEGTDISLAELCSRLETTLGMTRLEETFLKTGGSQELRDKILNTSFPCMCSSSSDKKE